MDAVVVDTNVILAAKGMSEQAWPECVVACQERLDEIIEESEKVVIDDKWIILREYIDYLEDDDSTTDPRNGGSFLEWFIRNRENSEQCIQVPITPSEDGTSFEELPEAFSPFDSDDHKFIAVAVVYEDVYQQKATILQSVDSQWYGSRNLFIENGLIVEFICEENIRHLHERREKRRHPKMD
ncbi:hypothetical protein F4009_08525 [Candidatus Poribacteria bacterium]|nr:hypothetical protein [Candidatus Poribacteria bacterium]MYH82913.1 hypothetical protein [Candidatus Poribacteria bacterium]MYK94026.1 hypothetical protein [Candidatus Poribacteria bacterium]